MVDKSKSLQSITLRDIAIEAKVSVATVSLSLNNHPRISETTRKHVLEVAERLGYKPNPMVTSLMTQMRGTRRKQVLNVLGWINHHKESDFWETSLGFNKELFAGASERAAELGFRLDQFHLAAEGMKESRMSQILHTRAVQGIIIPPLSGHDVALVLDWEKFSTVAIGFSLLSPNPHRVSPNHFHNIRLALRELHERGYHRIGYISSDGYDERIDHSGKAAFLEDSSQSRVKDRIPLLEIPFWTRENSAKLHKWFQKHKPAAIIANSHNVGVVLKEVGVTSPDDYFFSWLNVEEPIEEYSGIYQRAEAVGAATVDLLTSMIYRNERGIPEYPKLSMIPGVWKD